MKNAPIGRGTAIGRGLMRVIIVGRDRELIQPLIEKLTERDFEVIVVENGAAVRSFIKKGDIQFLVAEGNLLVNRSLAGEVLKRCPLARLVALSSAPTLLGMVEAVSSGLTDYFPRRPEYFDNVVKTLVNERSRLVRWQHVLLSSARLSARGEAAEGSPEAGRRVNEEPAADDAAGDLLGG